jgi:hypothetical protein
VSKPVGLLVSNSCFLADSSCKQLQLHDCMRTAARTAYPARAASAWATSCAPCLCHIRSQPPLHAVAAAITYGCSLDLGDFLRTLPSQAADGATGRASWQPGAPANPIPDPSPNPNLNSALTPSLTPALHQA